MGFNLKDFNLFLDFKINFEFLNGRLCYGI